MKNEAFKIIDAGPVSAHLLAPHIRDVDKLEVALCSGQDALDALLESIKVSDDDLCWTATLSGDPVAMFGANKIEENVGGIWLLASDGIYTNKRDFMRKSLHHLALMHERYEWLTNFIHEENWVTRRWLEALGFKPVQLIEEFGVGKAPFVQYVSKRD